jgi:TIR domain/Domain of unknown function (DUF4062)
MTTKLRIFIASPGDVSEERDIASHVVGELDRMFGPVFNVDLEAIRWETHAFPDIGDDAQDVINTQIGEFDVLVGVMWKRFGTPTKRAKSGTGEEFHRAFQLFKDYGRPKIMFYFREAPFYTTDLIEISQFRKVAQFRRQLEKLGVLFWSYDTPLQFERNVREHLVRQLISVNNGDQKAVVLKAGAGIAGAVAGAAIGTVFGGPIGGAIGGAILDKRYQETASVPCSVFIAYSHHDKQHARQIYRALRAAGFRVWLDEEDLLPGQMWHREVDRAIRNTDVILLLLSKATDLKRGYVAKEIDVATEMMTKKGGTIVIPVRVDDVEPPPRIKHLQWIDLFQPDGLERLTEAVESVCKSKGATMSKDSI